MKKCVGSISVQSFGCHSHNKMFVYNITYMFSFLPLDNPNRPQMHILLFTLHCLAFMNNENLEKMQKIILNSFLIC